MIKSLISISAAVKRVRKQARFGSVLIAYRRTDGSCDIVADGRIGDTRLLLKKLQAAAESLEQQAQIDERQ